ncbi:MAG: hypothetical protein ACI9HA_002947, partial [Dinoroseobacter sp.]
TRISGWPWWPRLSLCLSENSNITSSGRLIRRRNRSFTAIQIFKQGGGSSSGCLELQHLLN